MYDEDSDCYDSDEVPDLPELALNAHCNLGKYPQVSGWDDDTDGIEEARNPEDSTEKEILEAAENGNLNEVIKLVSTNKYLVNVADKDGYTPLHRASYNNHPQVVKYLLDSGANISALTIDSWQPLHSACKWNSLECAELLIYHGADINASSEGGLTPLHLAAGNSEAVLLIQLLISHPELKPNMKDRSGDSPYAIAKRSGPNAYLFECFENYIL